MRVHAAPKLCALHTAGKEVAHFTIGPAEDEFQRWFSVPSGACRPLAVYPRGQAAIPLSRSMSNPDLATSGSRGRANGDTRSTECAPLGSAFLPRIPEHAVHGFRARATTDSGIPKKLDAILSEQLVGAARNEWTASIGIDGRHDPDYAADEAERGPHPLAWAAQGQHHVAHAQAGGRIPPHQRRRWRQSGTAGRQSSCAGGP